MENNQASQQLKPIKEEKENKGQQKIPSQSKTSQKDAFQNNNQIKTTNSIVEKEKKDNLIKANSLKPAQNRNQPPPINNSNAPPQIYRTETDPEYKRKVLDKYRSYLLKDQCGRCKMLGIFVCEHNTTVRDSLKNRILSEGTFYRSPRRSQSFDDKEKQVTNNSHNTLSKSNNFENKLIMQNQTNEKMKKERKKERKENYFS